MQEAQTFAIRCTVHHKPQMYMGNLRPFGCSSNNICSLVVFTVVDCAAIELYVLHSLQNAMAKLHKLSEIAAGKDKNNIKRGEIL